MAQIRYMIEVCFMEAHLKQLEKSDKCEDLGASFTIKVIFKLLLLLILCNSLH